jgi:Protein of unknown function (DUF2798)
MIRSPSRHAKTAARNAHPRYVWLLVPTIMAIGMTLVVSLVQTVVRRGLVLDLVSVWLASVPLGLVVAVPTAIALDPCVRRLVDQLTGVRRTLPPQDTAE